MKKPGPKKLSEGKTVFIGLKIPENIDLRLGVIAKQLNDSGHSCNKSKLIRFLLVKGLDENVRENYRRYFDSSEKLS